MTILKKDDKSRMIPWPANWTDYHYNACNEPCDMLIGPCVCGATHIESESWIQKKLQEHRTIIQ